MGSLLIVKGEDERAEKPTKRRAKAQRLAAGWGAHREAQRQPDSHVGGLKRAPVGLSVHWVLKELCCYMFTA